MFGVFCSRIAFQYYALVTREGTLKGKDALIDSKTLAIRTILKFKMTKTGLEMLIQDFVGSKLRLR